MIELQKTQIEQVGGAMDLPPFDPDNICVISSGPAPQRSDYPAGAGGDAAYRYAVAEYDYNRRKQIEQNC